MSTLIAFASKYGFTKNCAEILAKKLNGKVIVADLGVNHPNPADYDTVIIGGPIYAGKIRKPVKQFCTKNLDLLKKKRLGLFVCGLAEGEDADKQFDVFPKELLDTAIAKDCFGGECNYEKMNFIEKVAMKKITGFAVSQIRIEEDRITRFAEQMIKV